ncbi:thioredoxin family protein [Actinomadura terrae]|uniref:thioredoxin family protein n=1 Tax=Actinomadura terrae TaxID=604353 RepID=UPI001FA7B457|nr:thioredoxin domain-containing protein [Actinomadura terrae]
MGSVIDVTDSSFPGTVEQSKITALAVFGAVWSDVCRALDPVLADVANEYDRRLVVAKVDIDDEPQTTKRYDITSIPTLHVFKGGKIVGTWIGPANKARVVSLVTPHL